MSIYIERMKLPSADELTGSVKVLLLYSDGMVIDNANGTPIGQAVELPEHGRLIDADALMAKACPKRYARKCFTDCEYYDNTDRGNCGEIKYKLYCLIKDAPTIIPASGGDEE